MKNETADYVPFGIEWEAEMKKLPKDTLIKMLAKASKLKEAYKELSEKQDQLIKFKSNNQ